MASTGKATSLADMHYTVKLILPRSGAEWGICGVLPLADTPPTANAAIFLPTDALNSEHQHRRRKIRRSAYLFSLGVQGCYSFPCLGVISSQVATNLIFRDVAESYHFTARSLSDVIHSSNSIMPHLLVLELCKDGDSHETIASYTTADALSPQSPGRSH